MSAKRLPIDVNLPFTAPQYGLLSTATNLDLQDPHWQMGINYEPLCPHAATTYSVCTSGLDNVEDDLADPTAKEATTEWAVRGSTPFTVRTQIDCSPVGVWEEFPERVEQSLTRAEEYAVEQAFWTGLTEGNTDQKVVYPHLAHDGDDIEDNDVLLQPEVTVVSTTPMPIRPAVGLLEAAIRECYPGVATLHVPLALSTEMRRVARERSGLITTFAGSKVVLGGGYPGTAPDGSSQAGVYWIYATGEMFYNRGELHTHERVDGLDTDVNTLSLMAERTYVVGWNCCLYAVPVAIETEETS